MNSKQLSEVGPITINVDEQLSSKFKSIENLSRAISDLSKVLSEKHVLVEVNNCNIVGAETGISIK
jgi:hypothetical protein